MKLTKGNTKFSSVRQEFLDLVWELDKYRTRGVIEEGQYRQKGNIWRDFVIELVKNRCGYEFMDRKIKGLTDKHDLDLTFIHRNTLLVAGEAKMLGSPEHKTETGEMKPERSTGIDLDKRLKEVKHTPVDLKLSHGFNVGEWSSWKSKTVPHFYSFWASRIATRDNVHLIIEKFTGLQKYNNGVGVLLYREDKRGYKEIKDERLSKLDIDLAIDSIGSFLNRHVR